VAVPDLSGYRFMCGRLVATVYEQAALHMYDEDHGTRLVMLARTMSTEQKREDVAARSSRHQRVRVG
jgi:hypothetical protein